MFDELLSNTMFDELSGRMFGELPDYSMYT